jgi:hypothetical protein
VPTATSIAGLAAATGVGDIEPLRSSRDAFGQSVPPGSHAEGSLVGSAGCETGPTAPASPCKRRGVQLTMQLTIPMFGIMS